MGALSVTGREKYQQPFRPLVPGVRKKYPTVTWICWKPNLSRVTWPPFIVEPIQGEGGIIVPPEGYLCRVSASLRPNTAPCLLADEVQTGFGRTGYLFGCDYEQVGPDIICLAKALGGGVMPVSAYVAAEEVWQRGYGSSERGATTHIHLRWQ